ncbi:MAG: hypothetical protein ABW185_07920 [Sedimenticola sp.]
MPDTFAGDDTESWEDWISQFEDCASLNGWDDDLQVKFLCLRLKGQARSALRDIDSEYKDNYDDLKQELYKRFATVKRPDLCKSELLSRRKLAGESYLQLSNSIRSLAVKAYPDLPSNIRDELAKDQFVRALEGVELSLKIRHANPKTLDEAVRMTLEWEAVERDVKYSQGKSSTTAVVQPDRGAAAGSGHSDGTSELMSVMKDLVVLLKDEKEQKTSAGCSRGFGRGRPMRVGVEALGVAIQDGLTVSVGTEVIGGISSTTVRKNCETQQAKVVGHVEGQITYVQIVPFCRNIVRETSKC